MPSSRNTAASPASSSADDETNNRTTFNNDSDENKYDDDGDDPSNLRRDDDADDAFSDEQKASVKAFHNLPDTIKRAYMSKFGINVKFEDDDEDDAASTTNNNPSSTSGSPSLNQTSIPPSSNSGQSSSGPTSTSGHGGIGGLSSGSGVSSRTNSGGRGGGSSGSASTTLPSYTVKHSSMGVRMVPRALGLMGSVRVQLSRYDRGTGQTRIKNMEIATRPLDPLLSSSNYARLLSTSFDPTQTVADDVHLWQDSLRRIKDRAVAFDMDAIFLIPNDFDTATFDSFKNATRTFDSILNFDILDDRDYFDWQTYIHKFGHDEDIQSDIWMTKFLKSSMDASLYNEVIVEFDDLAVSEQGAVSLFRLIVKRMVSGSEEARRHLIKFIEQFDIRQYPGENVTLACVRIKEVCKALGPDSLPNDLLSRVLEGFGRSSTKDFSLLCSQLRVNFLTRTNRTLMGNTPLTARLNDLLADLEDRYFDLKAGMKWEGAGHVVNAQDVSAFNVVSTDTEDDDVDDYAIYKASTSGPRLPFQEWVRSAICRYCKKQGHIRPDCRKLKADERRGVYQPAPNSQQANDSSPRPSGKKFTSTKLRALKVALDDLFGDDGDDNGAHGTSGASPSNDDEVSDDTVSALMCALGLKD